MPAFSFGVLLYPKSVPYLNILGKITQNKGLDGTLLASHAEIQVIHLLQQEGRPAYTHGMGHMLVGTDPRLALDGLVSSSAYGFYSCGGFCVCGVWDFLVGNHFSFALSILGTP